MMARRRAPMIDLNPRRSRFTDLADINPANPHLFKEDRWQDHFARLRAEDPVHLNELETSGRYWSITKYDDVRAIDGDWETFSSAEGITLGFPNLLNDDLLGRLCPNSPDLVLIQRFAI